MLNPSDFKQALLAIDSLGTTPSILARVSQLAKHPDTDLKTICSLMRNDGPLTADILRISNSPYFSPARLHSNLSSAVNHMGMREVLRVVNLSLARQLFARDLGSYGISALEYWATSVTTGLVMEALAQAAGLDHEDAYTAGILHAIGRVLINRVIEEHGSSIFWDGSQPIEDWERASVGFDHAEAGAMLLERWSFPPITCAAIRAQLTPDQDEGGISLGGALRFTRRFLGWTGSEFEHDEWSLPADDPFVRATGLTQARAQQLATDCRDELACIRQSVDLG